MEVAKEINISQARLSFGEIGIKKYEKLFNGIEINGFIIYNIYYKR